MEYFSSSSFDPSYLQNDEIQPPCAYTTQLLEPQNDQIIQTPSLQDDHDDDLDHLLAQIPCFLEEDDHYQQQQQQLNTVNHGQRRKSSSSDRDDPHAPHNNNDKKKQRIIHREVERQRRHEMSSLHASLRSLLPLDYIKGKRSISDHIDMATKYIEQLQERMRVLGEQRDALKLERCNSKGCDYEVSVNPWNNGGVEVIVCTSSCDGCSDQRLSLSKVLQCLTEQGLDVVSCTSNRVNSDNKWVHSIQAQVADGRSNAINPVDLQQKLVDIHNFT